MLTFLLLGSNALMSWGPTGGQQTDTTHKRYADSLDQPLVLCLQSTFIG